MQVTKRTIMVAAAVVAVLVAAGGGWLYSELDSTRSSLRETEAHLRLESATLTTTRGDLSATVVQLNDTLATLGQTRTDLGAERLTRDRLQEDKTVLVAEKASLTRFLQDANTEIATLEASNTTLRVDLDVAVGRKEQLTSALAVEVTEHTETIAALFSLEVEHEELTETASHLIALYGDVEALEREIGSLQEQRRPLLLKTERNELACTGSMEPKLTCLDEVTILRNYAPRDVAVGTIVVYQGEQECVAWVNFGYAFGSPIRSCTQYQRPQILHRVVEIGATSYLMKGDANREADGWIAVEDVLGYVIQVHRNVHPENATLRDAMIAAEAELDIAEQRLDVAQAAWDAQVDSYCGVGNECQVYYYGASDPIYIVWQEYRRVYSLYSQAFDTYECWYENAEDSEYPGHIPHSCN